jgi:hypothetical protein
MRAVKDCPYLGNSLCAYFSYLVIYFLVVNLLEGKWTVGLLEAGQGVAAGNTGHLAQKTGNSLQARVGLTQLQTRQGAGHILELMERKV